MLLAGVRVDAVTEGTLQGLLGVGENRSLDFKRDQYGNGLAARKEFAADVSALANTIGGHLILGIAEENGLAVEVTGVELDNVDAERVRLEQIARTGIQPRIMGLRIEPVPLANGRHAIVIEVPESFSRPHRVVIEGSNRFWARAGGGKYEPDVLELGALYSQGPSTAEKSPRLSPRKDSSD